MKYFEEVVADILSSSPPHINRDAVPTYYPIPDLPPKDVLDLINSSIDHNTDIMALSQTERGDNEENSTIPAPVWPFNILPSAGCVRSCSSDRSEPLGKLSGMRAVRKEGQLRSLIQCVLAMMPTQSFLVPVEACSPHDEKDVSKEGKRIQIVDFAGGTGHLGLPLALLLPNCDIIVVDLKATSLELVHEKANQMVLKEVTPTNPKLDEDKMEGKNASKKKKKRPKPPGASREIDVTLHSNELRQCLHIPNLYTFHGSISTYAEKYKDFDIGLALHACGEATDLVLRACGVAKASFIVSPCCVGKLSRKRHNPYIYHATTSNEPTISYPQSQVYCKYISSSEGFDALAKAADYSEMKDMRTSRNASRRTAKALLEMDRLLFMKEKYGYNEIVLTRMDPWEASPKNDILIGWQNESYTCDPYLSSHNGFKHVTQCSECNADINMAINQLVSPREKNNLMIRNESTLFATNCSVEWTTDEELYYRNILETFRSNHEENTMSFPTGMGSRKRKIVHFLAEDLKLRHWSEGKRDAEKVVVVGKKST
jgi:hypothetical protein